MGSISVDGRERRLILVDIEVLMGSVDMGLVEHPAP